MNGLLVSIFALTGLLCGNCLAVLIYRLPRGLRLSRSIFMAAGKSCYWRKAKRRQSIELATAFLFVCCGLLAVSIESFIFTAFMLVIAFIDWERQLILDKVLFYLLLFILGVKAAEIQIMVTEIIKMLTGCLLGGGLLLALSCLTGGMGLGDVKFAALLGLWFGGKLTLLLLFLAFGAGGLVAVFLLLAGRRKGKDTIPFGPFLALAAEAVLLCGPQLLKWYSYL